MNKNVTKNITPKMLKDFKTAIENWKSESYKFDKHMEKEMEKVYASDRASLTTVYNFLSEKDYDNARDYARMLDTIVREQIPSDIWEFLFEDYV